MCSTHGLEVRVMSTLVLIPTELKQRSQKAPGPLSSPVDFLRMRMHPHFMPPVHFPCVNSSHFVSWHQSCKPSYQPINGWQSIENQYLESIVAWSKQYGFNGQWHLQEWWHGVYRTVTSHKVSTGKGLGGGHQHGHHHPGSHHSKSRKQSHKVCLLSTLKFWVRHRYCRGIARARRRRILKTLSGEVCFS